MAGFSGSRVVFLVTGNFHKFDECRGVLAEYKLATAMLRKVGLAEIQDDHIENIARVSVLDAAKKFNLPIVVEDAGLFVEALKDFPGPYSSYVYRTIGNEGILKLMKRTPNRYVCFKSVVAFLSPEQSEPVCFSGKVEGELAREKRGDYGFGFDPIFKPSGHKKTFAEMTLKEKNQYSHRAAAFRKFAEWYITNCQNR